MKADLLQPGQIDIKRFREKHKDHKTASKSSVRDVWKVKQPVGALSETLAGTSTEETRGLNIQGNIAKLETSQAFQNAREFAKNATKQLLPEQLSTAAAKLDEYTRDFVKTVPFRGSGSGSSRGELFEQLGFYYDRWIDHNTPELQYALASASTGQTKQLLFNFRMQMTHCDNHNRFIELRMMRSSMRST
eukprot:Skav228013  [mRNA]  locus=scaffold1073:69655:77874:+ [translate_table: standard]